MAAKRFARASVLLAGVAIYLVLPGLAHAAPALYTGTIHLRLWGLEVPYGSLLDGPGLANSPSGNLVNLAGSGPAVFALPSGQLALTTSLFDPFPTPASLDFRSTKFSAVNDVGSFFGGGAPNATAFAPVPSIPGSQFGVSFSGEPNRFGGVMRLLGRFDWQGELGASCGLCPYRTVIPLTPIGGSFGGTATATAYVGGSLYEPTLVKATVWGFPWDTGTVGGFANVAPSASPTTTSSKGTDLRTASGLGTLQLVTPFLVRVNSQPPDCGGCVNHWFYAGTARAELRFVPEPGATALLAVGLSVLTVLYRGSKLREQ